MKFAAAILTFAAGALASSFEPEPSYTDIDDYEVTYTTKVVTAVTTYCPEPTEITMGESTYTVTEATTLTITDCPCTVEVPVTTISSVVCEDCPPSSFTTPAGSSIPTSIGTVTRPAPTFTASQPPIVTAGAGKAAALSGGALAGALGLAAMVL